MRKMHLMIGFCFALAASQANNSMITENKVKSEEKIGFTENKGQIHDGYFNSRKDVLYSGTDGKIVYHLKNDGISLQLNRYELNHKNEVLPSPNGLHETGLKTYDVSIYRIDINWLGINKDAHLKTDAAFEGCENFYSEAVTNGAIGVKTYKGITYQNIYQDIDLHYYSKNGELKYDYLLKRAGDCSKISYQIKGATSLVKDKEGNLIIKTPFGNLSEAKPTVFQNGNLIDAAWKINGDIVSYEISNFDPNEPLIIDPITRVWGTYYGGIASDAATNSFTDPLGFVYIYGSTYGSFGTVVATLGSHQSTFGGGGADDGYLAKFNSNGVRQWATYYGGSNGETFQCGAADASGNLYISGLTTSSAVASAIVTPGCHQPVFGGGAPSAADAFLVKFNNNGVRQWGTFYGGSGSEFGYGCAVDGAGNAYICGSTASSSAIATPGSHQSTFSGGFFLDGFIAKFNSSGVRQWGTYYGGNGVYDEMYSCKTDNSGNVYVVGRTATPSSTIIFTPGAQQTIYGGNSQDGMIVKFNSSGTRIWGTYYGGLGFDEARDLAIDNTNNFLYVVGTAASSSGTTIATVGSHQPAIGSGSINDAFLAKFDLNGVRQWGTYYGGIGADLGNGCVLDPTNNFIYITGSAATNTGTAISTLGSYQPTYGGGTYDAFIAKFSAAGVRQWGTYYGGAAVDYAWRCSIDAAGDLYVGGDTQSNTGTIIATSTSHQPIHGGSYDGFLVKFSDCIAAPSQPGTISGNTTFCSNTGTQTYSITTVSGASSYSWSLPGGWSGTSTSSAITVTPGLIGGVINVSAINLCGSSASQSLNISIISTPTIVLSPSNPTICAGSNATLSASGASNYTWNPGASTNSTLVVSPASTTIYTITGTNSSCSDTKTLSVNISTVNVLASSSSSIVCSGNTATLNATGANTYTWQPINLSGSTQTVQPTITTIYTVTGTNAFGCNATRTIQIVANTNTVNVSVTSNTSAICNGNSASLTAVGANSYSWSTGSTNSIINITPTATSVYTVTGFDITNCSNTKTISITVNANPTLVAVSNTSLICTGNNATLTASGANSYTWIPGGTGASITISPTVTTTYTVHGTASNGCQNSTTFVQNVSLCTGNENNYAVTSLSDYFKIYPNPSNGLFVLELTTIESDVTIDVYNAQGALILHENLTTQKHEINLQTLSNGIYFLKVNNSSIKLIKQ